jgi:transcriptional regulator with XRE-family HTH domain
MGQAIIPVMAIGDRIKTLRTGKGMTQEQLARAARLGLSHLARIEQGVINDPSWSTVRAIARALDVPVTELEESEEVKPAAAAPRAKGRPKKIE